MGRIRSAPMGYEMTSVRSICHIDDVEAKRIRGPTELDDADNVTMPYHAAMLLKRVQCTA